MEAFFINPHSKLSAFTGESTMLLDPHPSQQHAGPHHGVLRLQTETLKTSFGPELARQA